MKSSSAFALLSEMNMALCLISMVFKICHLKSPGANTPSEWKPCLSNLLSLRGLWTSHLLNMVFEVLGPESPEANVAAWERPCLELVQPEAAGGSSSSICSKHGFPPTKFQLIWPKNRNRACRTYCPQGVACSTLDKHGL